MKGDEAVTMQDFVDFFDEIPLPFSFTDTIFSKKISDSSQIDFSVFANLFSDSIFTPEYKKEKPKIFAIGKYRNGDAETYLLLKTKAAQSAVYVIALNEELLPKASQLLLSNKGKTAEINTVSIDKKFTITQVDEYKKSDGTTGSYASVLAYNTAGLFMVILNDGLKKGEELIKVNPIDTFPQLQPWSGNYATNKKNYVSIRDADTEKKMSFFIAMDRGNNCVAELKGEARWIKKDSALFDSNLDGCKIGFHFSKNAVRITEIVGCGSRRPMECSFNGSFARVARKNDLKKKK